jgi:uncharacterized membrane protein YdcZ (DUF606 family)
VNSGLGLLAIIATLLVAGAALSVQAPVNAVLARASGGLIAAACISFAIGLVGCLLLVVLDHYGALGLTVREISWQRLAGVGLVALGLVLARA